MDQSQVDAIVKRLDRVERQNRLWKRCGLAAALLLIIVVASAAGPRPGPVVFQDSLRLLDKNGRPRVVLYVEERRGLSCGLEVLDARGAKRIHLGVDENGRLVDKRK